LFADIGTRDLEEQADRHRSESLLTGDPFKNITMVLLTSKSLETNMTRIAH
jgi:hypothetical protein